MKIVKEECCESCGSTEALLESGGQFCGGTWYICQHCDDEATKAVEFYSSKFREQAMKKTLKEKE